MLTHRRRTAELNDGYVMLFAEEEHGRHEHYGNHIWELKSALPKAPRRVVLLAEDFFGIDAEEAEDMVYPDNIVNSAGAWDSPEFVSEVWEAFEPVGYLVGDGAVLLDWRGANLVYREEDAYGDVIAGPVEWLGEGLSWEAATGFDGDFSLLTGG